MKAGMVTQIRINPGNCQAILDVMAACNIDPYDGRSFAQCVSLSLDALIGMARRAGVIPEEIDPYQYLNRMGPFLNSGNTKKKHRYDDMLYQRASHGIQAPDMGYRPPVVKPYIPQHLQTTDDMRRNAKEGDIIPIKEDFNREEAMMEYNHLKGLCMREEATEEEIGRFGYLQNLLY